MILINSIFVLATNCFSRKESFIFHAIEVETELNFHDFDRYNRTRCYTAEEYE